MAVQGYRQGSAARGFRYIVPHVSYSPGSRSYCSLNKSRKNPKSFSMADRASVTRPTEPTLESQFQGPHTSEQLPVHLTGRDREYFTHGAQRGAFWNVSTAASTSGFGFSGDAMTGPSDAVVTLKQSVR